MAASGTGEQVAPSGVATIGPELALLTVVLLWASTFVITKAVFTEVSPLAFSFIRFALITLLAFGVLAVRGRGAHRERFWRLRRADLPRFAGAGLLGYTLYQLGFALGLERTSPFASSLLIAMVPLGTMVILAAAGEPTSGRGWLGLAVAIAGVLVFLADKRAGGGAALGDLLSLGAAMAFAGYGVVNRPLVRTYPPETYTAYAVLAGSIPLLAITTPAALRQDWAAISAAGWVAIIYMVILPVYVAYMLWNWAIARRGAAVATSASLLIPIVSGILSALFFAEGFGPLKLAGAALVLTGLVIVRLRR